MSEQMVEGLSGVRADYPIEQIRGLEDLFDGMDGLISSMQQILGGMRSIIRAYRVRDPGQRGKVTPIER